MLQKILLFLLTPAAAGVAAWRLWPRHPVLASLAVGLALAMVCQLALVLLHQRPVEAGLRTNVLTGIAYYLPFLAAAGTAIGARAGLKGVLTATLGVGIGIALATVLLDALRLVRLKLFV